MPSTPTNFQIGDWVTYLPEPANEFEIIAVPGTPYSSSALPVSAAVAPGFDFLLRRGGNFKGFEPYKSARKSELRPADSLTNNGINWVLLKDKKPGNGQEVLIFEERGDDGKGYIRTAVYRVATGIFTYTVTVGDKTTPYIAAGVRRWAMS